MSRGWDALSHQCEQLRCKQGVLLTLIDPVWQLLSAANICEPNLLEFADEDTLRQGAGDSTCPGGGACQDLWREVLVHDDVGDDHAPA